MLKSKKELAAATFAKYKDAKKAFVADDGNVFLTANAADLHANTNKGKKKLKIEVFERTDGEAKDTKPSAEDRIKSINELTTVEAVTEALNGETAKTVKAAGEEKIEALNKAATAKKGNNGTDAPEKRGEDKK